MYFPSLDETGWLTDSKQIGDRLLAYFFIASYSQTQLYKGHVASFAYSLQKGQGNMSLTTMEAQNRLYTLFSRYFTQVIAEVTEIPNPTAVNKALLGIYVSYTDEDGQVINLGEKYAVEDGVARRVANIING